MSVPSSAAPTTQRRGRPGYDRAAVVAVAVRVFNERGYDATSISDLAAELGLSKSALYHHVDSKSSILQEALDDALSGLEGVLDDAVATHASAADRFGAVVRGAVGVLTDKLGEVTLLLRVRGNSDVETAALARRRDFDHRVTAIVEAAQDEGLVRPDIDAAVATRLVFGMVNSVVEWYRPGGTVDPARLADDVLRLALEGLRAPRGDGPRG